MWWAIALSLAMSVLSMMSMKNMQKDQGTVVGDIEAPTTETGRAIPVVFGTREITGANVLWYGDVKTQAIKK